MAHDEAEKRRLALVAGLYRDVLIPLDADRVDDYVAADYIQHSSLAPPGRDALKAWLREMQTASPDAIQTIHRMIVDGEMVIAHVHVVRWPGDRGLAVADMFRVPHDRIAEHWEVIQEIPENPINPTPMF